MYDARFREGASGGEGLLFMLAGSKSVTHIERILRWVRDGGLVNGVSAGRERMNETSGRMRLGIGEAWNGAIAF